MKCCINCFNDNDIRDRIRSLKERGTCDFCGSTNVEVLDIDKAREIKNGYAEGFVADFRDLVDQFTDVFPKEKFSRQSDKLVNYLLNLTNSFNLPSDKLYDLLKALLPDYYRKSPDVFNNVVIPTYLLNDASMSTYGVFGINTWEDFENDIRYHNRFHSTMANTEMLTKFFDGCRVTLDPNDKKRYFRARVSRDGKAISPENMGAAPRDKSSSGRLNASGIGYLYLCDDDNVALTEIKAAVNDVCTTVTYEIVNQVEVVDISNIVNVGIFQSSLDKDVYLMNQKTLQKLDQAMRTSSGRKRSEVAYVPTEYISDLIKAMDVDGIMYDSTVSSASGKNVKDIVLFKEDKVRRISSETRSFRIKALDYQRTSL